MEPLDPLTKRQRQIFEFIAEELRAKSVAPSLEEIGRRFNLSALATVHKHLTNLETKGYIARRWNRTRSITLLWQTECCPTCGQVKPGVERAELTAG